MGPAYLQETMSASSSIDQSTDRGRLVSLSIGWSQSIYIQFARTRNQWKSVNFVVVISVAVIVIIVGAIIIIVGMSNTILLISGFFREVFLFSPHSSQEFAGVTIKNRISLDEEKLSGQIYLG